MPAMLLKDALAAASTLVALRRGGPLKSISVQPSLAKEPLLVIAWNNAWAQHLQQQVIKGLVWAGALVAAVSLLLALDDRPHGNKQTRQVRGREASLPAA